MGALDGLLRTAKASRLAREGREASPFNADKTRYIAREFLGWVCYVGRVGPEGDFAGQRAGVTSSETDADKWLAGEEIKWDIPADPFGNLVDQNGSSR